MNTTNSEISLNEDLDLEIDLEEMDWEFASCIRPQFKDAGDFGRACRTLAMPIGPREEYSIN